MRRASTPFMLLLPFLLVACDTGEMGDADDVQVGADTADTAATVDPAAQMDPGAIEAEVGQVRDAWADAAMAGDAAAIGSLYADDAVLAGPEGELAEGRQAIEEALNIDGVTDMDISAIHTEVGTDMVSEVGTFSQTLQTPEGEEQTVSGRYMVVLGLQEDGNWRIVHHMSTPDEAAQQENEM